MIDTNRISGVEDSERAVSPVIGVILMVAITVILAAVIGTFVLDLGQNVQNTGPSASMGFEDAEDTWTAGATDTDFISITHQSGESLDADAVRIVVRNESDNNVVAEWDGQRVKGNFSLNGNDMVAGDTITTGDVIVVYNSSTNGDLASTASPGYEYGVTVISTNTDNRIATGVVEVQ